MEVGCAEYKPSDFLTVADADTIAAMRAPKPTLLTYEAGLRIPEDISVVGFSDTGTDMLTPPLTTAREYPEQVGKHLAQQLLQRITSPELPAQHYTIPTQLVLA